MSIDGSGGDDIRAPERRVGRIELGMQGVYIAATGSECHASGDLVGCSSDASFAGIELTGAYVPVKWVSLGPVGSYAFRFGTAGAASSTGERSEERIQHWHAGIQGRFHPLAFDAVVPWGGLELGAAGVRTIVERTGYASDNGTSSHTLSAALFGAGLGVDVWALDRLALTGGAWLWHFGAEGSQASPPPADQQPFYTSPLWYTLGLGLRVGI